MLLKTRCELSFQIETPTPFIFMLRPRSGHSQWVQQETYQVTPGIQVTQNVDLYGNLVQRLVAPKGQFDIETSSVISTVPKHDVGLSAPFVKIANLPDETLMYLLPSRYCESDRHNDLALEIVQGVAPGYDQVAAIVTWIKNEVKYIPGSSGYPISAIQAIERGHGVCRDLAHVGVSLCRSLCIPCRLVVGYLHELEPMDIHAWFEAFVGDRWYTFDATQKDLEGARVVIGYGRDAADVAICNQYGPLVDPFHMRVEVSVVD